MSKYYRVIKDHPMWEIGAILSNMAGGDSYKPITDLWQKTLDDGKELPNTWHEGAMLVENQKEWFERVYDISVLGKTKYLTKDLARAAHEKLHKA